jgi:hypothetical protein
MNLWDHTFQEKGKESSFYFFHSSATEQRSKCQIWHTLFSTSWLLLAPCFRIKERKEKQLLLATEQRRKSQIEHTQFSTATCFILSNERESDDPSEPQWLRGVLCERHEQHSVKGFWDLAQYTVGLAYFRSTARLGQNGWSNKACDYMIAPSLLRSFTFSFPCRFFHFHLITFPFQEMSFLLVIQRAFIVIHSWGLWAERKRRERERERETLHKDKLRMSNPIWNFFFFLS